MVTGNCSSDWRRHHRKRMISHESSAHLRQLWEYPRAPSIRWMWAEGATVAVLEFLGDMMVGCRVSSRRAILGWTKMVTRRRSRALRASRAGRARPRMHFPLFGGMGEQEVGMPRYDPERLGIGFRHVRGEKIRCSRGQRQAARCGLENKRKHTYTGFSPMIPIR